MQNDYSLLAIGIYLILHIPAFIMLILGFVFKKKHPLRAKRLFIFAAIYFVIGAGVCGSWLK